MLIIENKTGRKLNYKQAEGNDSRYNHRSNSPFLADGRDTSLHALQQKLLGYQVGSTLNNSGIYINQLHVPRLGSTCCQARGQRLFCTHRLRSMHNRV